jgi:Leucine-rich repeat (LRR) protein
MAVMPKLEYLDVSSNKITSIPDLTTVFPVLLVLSAEYNNIYKMNQTTAINLYLSRNQMTEIPDFRYIMDKLAILELSSNKITEIMDGQLPPLPNCHILDLGYNYLTMFPNFKNMTSLKYLSLAGNQISFVPELINMDSLQELRLINNKFMQFPNLTSVSRSLIKLKLYYNEIVDFPEALIVPLTNLQKLSVGIKIGTPIVLPDCCLLKTSGQLVIEIHKSTIHCDQNTIWCQRSKLINVLSPNCSSPPEFLGKSFEEVSSTEPPILESVKSSLYLSTFKMKHLASPN